jgi:transcriptional regulator with XRE-family HTH domain
MIYRIESAKRFGGNMKICITLKRYGRIATYVMSKPLWAVTVRRLREAKEWSQGELAEKASVRGNTLSDALNGKTSPRLETLEAVAAALGVPFWRLFVDDRQADLLLRQDASDKAMANESEIAARIEQRVMVKLAHHVKEATREEVSGQPLAEPAKPLAEPARPRLAATGSRKKR